MSLTQRQGRCRSRIIPLLFIALIIPSVILPFEEGKGTAQASESIAWKSYETALSRAKTEEKAVYLYFYTDQCFFCRKMEKETLSAPKVIRLLGENFFSVRVDVNKRTPLSKKYPVSGVPVSWFLDSEGANVGNLPGFIPAEDFTKVLTYVGKKHYKTTSFKDYLKANP